MLEFLKRMVHLPPERNYEIVLLQTCVIIRDLPLEGYVTMSGQWISRYIKVRKDK